MPGIAECVDYLRFACAHLMDERKGAAAIGPPVEGARWVNECIRAGMAGEPGRFWAREADGREVGTRGRGLGA